MFANFHFQLYIADFNADFSRGFFTPLCYDSKELPNFEALRDRMTTIALEHGLLGGAADESVEAMIYALEVSFLIDLMICFSLSPTGFMLNIMSEH